MHSLSLVAALSVLLRLGFSSPVQPPQCTVPEHSVGANSTHCLTAFEQLKVSITLGDFQDQYRSCAVSVAQPAGKSLDSNVLEYSFTQLMGTCPYGSYALDAAAILYVTPVEDRTTSVKIEKRVAPVLSHWRRVRDIASLTATIGFTVWHTACDVLGSQRPRFHPDLSSPITRALGTAAAARGVIGVPPSSTDVVAGQFIDAVIGGINHRWHVLARFTLVHGVDWHTVLHDPSWENSNRRPAFATFAAFSITHFLSNLEAPRASYRLQDAEDEELLVTLALHIVQVF